MKTIRRKNMKTMKCVQRTLALCLSILLAVGLMSVSAFAIKSTDKGTITVVGVEDDATATAYQIMTVNINDTAEQPSDPVYTWVSAIADWVGDKYPAYINTADYSVKEAFSNASAADLAQFYDALAAAIRKDSGLSVSAAGTVKGSGTISNLDMGNYLILTEGGMRVYKPSSASLVPKYDSNWTVSANPETVTVAVKSSEPSIDKKIVLSDGSKVTVDNANVGDSVKYELTAAIPEYPANAIAHEFVVADSISEGLTLTDGTLKVYGVKADASETLLAKDTAYTQTTTTPQGDAVTFALNFVYSQIKDYQSVRVEYSAVVNEKAVVGPGGNPNTVKLIYNNNPYKKNDWKTDEVEVKVYTYGIEVVKVDKNSETTKLSGAEFTLSVNGTALKFAKNGDVYSISATSGNTTLTTDDNGLIRVEGLDEGTYTLTETKAPGGYMIPVNNTFTITLTDVKKDGQLTGNAVNAKGATGTDAGVVSEQITNSKVPVLPPTGGLGTVIFTTVGILLMGAGVVAIVVALGHRKRG